MKSGLSEDDKKLYNQAVPDALTQKSNRGRFTKIVILGAVLFTVIATVLIFMLGGLGEPTEEITKVETPVPAEPEVKEEPVKEEAKPPVNDKLTKIKPGEIANLPQRTGNSYIVVNSFFDGDLAQDYANVLSARGKSPMIIPPFAEYRFYRVAIAEYGTFAEALRNLESFKAEYGTKIWALRY